MAVLMVDLVRPRAAVPARGHGADRRAADLAGWLRLGNLMRFVSRSVITGFVNALAILIFMAQLPEITGGSSPGRSTACSPRGWPSSICCRC
jgi:SulP family sulfate permease